MSSAGARSDVSKRAGVFASATPVDPGRVRDALGNQSAFRVMQEFLVAATRKLGADPLLGKGVLHRFERLEVIQITPARIAQASDCSIRHRIFFWDALIVTAAEAARCVKVLSKAV